MKMKDNHLEDELSEVTSNANSEESRVPDYQDIIGQDDVDVKGEPVVGQRYLIFNIIMIIVLSIVVVMNTNENTLNEQV